MKLFRKRTYSGFLIALAILLLTAVAAAVIWRWTQRAQTALAGGPMIQIGSGDGCRGITICWRTAKESNGEAWCWPLERPSKIASSGFNPEATRFHQIQLSKLEPGVEYGYSIASNDIILGGGTFTTFWRGPITERLPVRFAVFGDSGSGKSEQYAVARQIAKHEIDLILHTGDLIYPKGEDKDYKKKFYEPYENLIDRKFFFPVLGNHDYGTNFAQPWIDNFALPGKERYYSFNLGNAHFTALDSCYPTDEMLEWLKNDLAWADNPENGIAWKFVHFHYPVFSNTKDRWDSEWEKALWHPIFARYGVDIVFCGHDHIYTRFKPVDGVNYITEGAGGKNLYQTREHPLVERTNNQEFGFGLVEITGNRLTFAHLNPLGWVIDEFVLEKRPQK